jgi:hypothetical protein
MTEKLDLAELRAAAEAVKDIDWTVLDVILRVEEGNTIDQIGPVKTFLMKFNPETCIRLIQWIEHEIDVEVSRRWPENVPTPKKYADCQTRQKTGGNHDLKEGETCEECGWGPTRD